MRPELTIVYFNLEKKNITMNKILAYESYISMKQQPNGTLRTKQNRSKNHFLQFIE